ncbi:MAG: YbaB/EbfC family nucleoid-associated protein [Clostridia bacterium]|nr:YbaB/EbfC family nucleoid-associated protein [Clostridia bacterium]MDD4686375.1 YbaB/EbfC family nucleoid-associated protein [Clostridia bacterium]
MNNFRGGFGGFGGANLGNLMKQAQKMQQEIEEAKKVLAEKEFKATVGGGMVEVNMNGTRILKSIKLKPEIVDAEDIEMLEDLICAAINDALNQISKAESEQLPQIPGM